MRLFFTVSFLLLTTANHALAQVVQARYGASCGFLSNKIYCFGGSATVKDDISDAAMTMLDISNNSGSTADDLKNKWATVTTNPNGLDIKSRDSPQAMQLPDGKTLVLSGGWNNAFTNLVSQTIAFNGENQFWTGYANYTEPPYGNRQIYHASSVYVPKYGIGFYGGIETNYNSNWAYPGVNVTAYEEADRQLRFIGYTSLTFLDIRNQSNLWSIFPIQNNKPNVFSMFQTSVFDANSNRIFFFGGRYEDPVTTNYIYYTFESSITFDLTKGEWGTQTLNGNGPSSRVGHSTTLLGPNQRNVLLYGGESNSNNDRALLDYCFNLNLDTYHWTQQTIQAEPNVIMIRTQHSAVVVNNDTLFIVFGKDTSDVPTLSLLILNVTNPLNVTLLDKYVDPNAVLIPLTVIPGTESMSKLSSGATAGIAVGATVGGLIAIGAIVFFILKKKKTEKDNREIEELEKQRQKQIEEPVMEVNWDEIEKKYIELPMSTASPGCHFIYSPQLSDDTTTVIDNNSVTNPRSPMLIQQGLDIQRPNAIDEDGANGVTSHQLLQKPDGA